MAEGVESEATAARLVELECDDLQGFWFARPMVASEVLGWASEHAASRTKSAAATSAVSRLAPRPRRPPPGPRLAPHPQPPPPSAAPSTDPTATLGRSGPPTRGARTSSTLAAVIAGGAGSASPWPSPPGRS